MEAFKYCMEIESNELNLNPTTSSSDPIQDCFFKPQNWDNSSMDHHQASDPFESALSSIVSSPAATNYGAGDGAMIRELIGRLGNICNNSNSGGEISPSPQSYNNNNSTNTSCYGTPLNSPPKLNLSVADHHIRAKLNIPGSYLPPSLAPFSGDPGFAERAAKFSSFVNGQYGLNEAEFGYRSMPRIDPGKVSRGLSSGQGARAGGSNPNSEKKGNRISRPSTPENRELADSREGSSVSDQIPSGDLGGKTENDVNAKKRKSISRGKAKEITANNTSSAKDNNKIASENEESNAKRSKKDGAGNEKDNNNNNNSSGGGKTKAESEDGNQKQTKENSKPPEPPKDYIHVRARRGQATDSHSLAERVRREKISERMKFLQDLVPGCNKVTGKAVMLDEIINYVQSLQRQVEFLSMKLATVNPRMDFNMEALLSKDIFQSRGSLPHALYQFDSSSPPAFPFGIHHHQPQQLPPLHNTTSTASETQFPLNPLNAQAALHRTPSIQLPAMDGFAESAPQVPTFFEDDLQSVVQMGFGQIQQQKFQGSMASSQMKVEL